MAKANEIEKKDTHKKNKNDDELDFILDACPKMQVSLNI